MSSDTAEVRRPVRTATIPGHCVRCGHKVPTRLVGIVKADEPGIRGIIRQCDLCSDRCDSYPNWHTIRVVS